MDSYKRVERITEAMSFRQPLQAYSTNSYGNLPAIEEIHKSRMTTPTTPTGTQSKRHVSTEGTLDASNDQRSDRTRLSRSNSLPRKNNMGSVPTHSFHHQHSLPSDFDSHQHQEVIVEEKRRRPNASGYTVHRYLRGRLLGKGGFAKVYMCTAMDTNKTYALKVVSKNNLAKPRAKQKLQAEIKIHRILKHPHICEYKHFFEDRENCYILMELCHNQSMNEMIKRRKRLTEPEAAHFMLQLIEAVQHMHEYNVIHRDLKLGNLFLDRDLNIKVGDFGLATRLENEDEKRKTICGTPNYIAPEVIQGSREERGHSFEVDIWSMGVILFTMLIGKPPYESKDVKSTYQRILANEYHFPSHVEVSDEVKDLIISMLQSDPTDRPTLDELRGHIFFELFTPDKYSLNALYVEPDWDVTEDGKLVPSNGDGAFARNASSKSVQQRQPFSSKDSNAVVDTMRDKTQKARVQTGRESRQDVPVRVATVASSDTAPTKPSRFQIYDESGYGSQSQVKKQQLMTPSMEDILAKAAALSVGNQHTPAGEIRVARVDTDADILQKMYKTLESTLTRIEERRSIGAAGSPKPASGRYAPSLWVTRYVDYTIKYGLGFLLNNGSPGVYFNDSTKAVLAASGSRFQYVERRNSNGPSKRGDQVSELYTLESYPVALQKKVTLLKHFRDYLMEQQQKEEGEGEEEEELGDSPRLANPNSSSNSSSSSSPLVYLKKWVRTKHAILFRLSNQTIQIVFYDQTEILLTPDERFVTFVNKARIRTTYCYNDELDEEISKRLKYAREILGQLVAGGQSNKGR